MTFVGQVEMTYALLRRINYSAFTPRTVVILVLLELGLVGMGLAAGSLAQGAGPFVAAAGVYPLYELAVWRSWRRTRHLATAPWSYQVSDALVGVSTPATHVEVSWTEASKVRTGRHAWCFTVASSRRQLVVPRLAFPPDAQRAIDALVAGRRSAQRASRQSSER